MIKYNIQITTLETIKPHKRGKHMKELKFVLHSRYSN